MNETIITSKDLADLGNNIQAVFRFFHPKGLKESELAERANEQNFYRVVYQHCKRKGVIT